MHTDPSAIHPDIRDPLKAFFFHWLTLDSYWYGLIIIKGVARETKTKPSWDGKEIDYILQLRIFLQGQSALGYSLLPTPESVSDGTNKNRPSSAAPDRSSPPGVGTSPEPPDRPPGALGWSIDPARLEGQHPPPGCRRPYVKKWGGGRPPLPSVAIRGQQLVRLTKSCY
eukprot:7272149-Pyramimonas_sp.AAC.7